MTDVADSRRIDAEIEHIELSSDPFVAAVRNTRMPMIITDPHQPDNPIVFANDAFCELTGYAREEVLNRNCRFLQGPGTDQDQVSKIRAAIDQRTSVEVEFLNYKKSGAAFWNRLLISPIFNGDGELSHFFGSQYDASVGHATEGALREAQQRLDALIRSSSEVRYSLNADWSELQELAGGDFIPDSTAGNRDWFAQYIPPEARDLVRAEIERAVRTETTYLLEHPVNRVDGTVGWALSRAVPLFDREGALTGWFGAASDITDRKRAEAALQELNDTLEQRVAESLVERNRVEDQLRQSQKLEAVGQLTGGVAHDFNNLLTVIRSSSDLLKRPGLSEERRERYIAAISDTVDRAGKLTGQLLAFARRQALQPAVFDVCDSVRLVSDMVRTLAGSRVAVTTALPEDACFVLADPSQFDTALVNMAVNARDAMDGEGRIEVSVRGLDGMPRGHSHPARSGAFVAVSVRDTGSGIAPDQIDRIFEPFFTTKETGKGTGLGLSQVFGFAKQSGGDITVESTPGIGSTFTLYLPRVSGEGRTAMEGFDPEPLAVGHGTCVLVVEDNADVGAFTQQSLGDLGYVTVLARNGDEALFELAKDAARFDAVFTDVVMPGMDGTELGRQIRERHPALPLVLTSGYSHVLAQSGTHGFELLHKPYSVEQLSRVLRKVVIKRIIG